MMRIVYLQRKEALLRSQLEEKKNSRLRTQEDKEVLATLRRELAEVQIMIQRNNLKEVLSKITREEEYQSLSASTIKLLEDKLKVLDRAEESINPHCATEWIEHEGKCIHCRQCMLEDLEIYINRNWEPQNTKGVDLNGKV